MATYGHYGDYNDFGLKNNSIYKSGNTQGGEVNKTDNKPAETIEFTKSDNKEVGFDLLTQNAGSAYGKALTLSTNFQIDKGLLQGLNDKEKAFLMRDINSPVRNSVRNFTLGISAAIEDIAEFA